MGNGTFFREPKKSFFSLRYSKAMYGCSRLKSESLKAG